MEGFMEPDTSVAVPPPTPTLYRWILLLVCWSLKYLTTLHLNRHFPGRPGFFSCLLDFSSFISKLFSFSALTLLVRRQEGHLACKKLDVGLLVVMIWPELCTAYSFSSAPPPSSLAPLRSRMETFWYRLTKVHLENGELFLNYAVYQLTTTLFVSCMTLMVLLFIRAPFYALLVFIAMCAVFWLFWLSYQYLPSDWLERLVCVPNLFCFLGQLSHLPYSFWR